MKECIGEVLQEMLKDHTYKQDEAPELTKQIADRVKNRLKLLELPRYKYMVQVVVGEQRGEGVRMGCRTFWDRDTDAYASETFTNDSIFCVATAYAVYLNYSYLSPSLFHPRALRSSEHSSTAGRAVPTRSRRFRFQRAMDFAKYLRPRLGHIARHRHGPTVASSSEELPMHLPGGPSSGM